MRSWHSDTARQHTGRKRTSVDSNTPTRRLAALHATWRNVAEGVSDTLTDVSSREILDGAAWPGACSNSPSEVLNETTGIDRMGLAVHERCRRRLFGGSRRPVADRDRGDGSPR